MLLLTVMLILLFGGGGFYGYRRGYYGPRGVSLMGVLLVVVIVLLAMGDGAVSANLIAQAPKFQW
jgi:hypothetical protein